KENIRQAFDRVAKEGQGSDLLVVYLAGHGVAARSEQDQYYYLTKEARSTEIDRDPGLRAVSTISSAELKEWLSRTNMPLKQVVILDTCAAGAAFGDMVKLADKRDLSTDQIRAIELLKDSTGSWILMGSAADAVSYEANRYAQGLLTYALLQGMQGAALEEDRVEVSRLFGFAQRQVEDLAKGIGGIQRPVMSAPKGQTFPIGLLNEAARKQIHLATLKPQLLRARVLDENDLDSLKLEPALRAELRAASLPVTRGVDRQDPQIVYLDSVVDEVPDALIPQLRYTVEGDKVKVRLRLLQNGKPVVERNLELPKGETVQLGRALRAAIVSESGKVRLPK
ncbi:MAG: caspase family protein, partial [Bryobacteraceae bacterium]